MSIKIYSMSKYLCGALECYLLENVLKKTCTCKTNIDINYQEQQA